MILRTEIKSEKTDFSINHRDKIMLLGSCFATNIGQQLQDHKFDVCLNPFGTLYNPISIAQSLELLMCDRSFSEEDVFSHESRYHTFYHHSSFSRASKAEFLVNANQHLTDARIYLKEASKLIITFGSSYVYQLISNKQVVSNCHKLPESQFDRYRLSVSAIVEQWNELLAQLKEYNPKLEVLFTVSPIRHIRDGMHANQLSKATLLLAIEELKANYFPAYEIVLDDLRDYRFYEEDMVHPNSLSIKYIWSKFGEFYFDSKTEAINKQWLKLKSALEHRPININSEEHKAFLRQTMLKLNQFGEEYPYICTNTEKDQLKEYL